jgi:hypothetical protein
MERLVDRTTNEIAELLRDENYGKSPAQARGAVRKIIDSNNKRLKAICDQERNWFAKAKWDVVVDGTNVAAAIDTIKHGIANRNARSDIYA